VTFHRQDGKEFIARLWATRKIGYLLQQIRLHGEEKEVVDEIVDLSIRYGIITPYTSFLVEETEMALRDEGRQTLVDQMRTQSTAMPAPVSGAQAVERSAEEKVLVEAEAPVAAVPPGLGGDETDEYGYRVSPVKYVGDKTFVLNDGAWTDTTFDPDQMEPVPVSFGSDGYFALIAARPEWGRYFALGDHVIVVLDGTAYEVREGEAPPVEAPGSSSSQEEGQANEPTPTAGTTTETAQGLSDTVLQLVLGLYEEITRFFSE
jgi:Ca-activated chloride channel family protein